VTGAAARQAEQAAAVTEILAGLEQQILGTILQVVSGPGGVASFLRRTLLGKGLNGPSLSLDVGQTDDIPGAPAAPGRTARPGLPAPRRILPLNTLRSVRDFAWKQCPFGGGRLTRAVNARSCT